MNWAEWVLAGCGCVVPVALAWCAWSEITWRWAQKRKDYLFYLECAEEVMEWRVAGKPTVDQSRAYHQMRIEAERGPKNEAAKGRAHRTPRYCHLSSAEWGPKNEAAKGGS